jgi:hypothetical protein
MMAAFFAAKPLRDRAVPETWPLSRVDMPDAWAAINEDTLEIVSVRYRTEVDDQLEDECFADDPEAPSMPLWIVAACRACPRLFERSLCNARVSAGQQHSVGGANGH